MANATSHTLGSVWDRSGGRFNVALTRDLPWLTPDQRRRAERLRQARMLQEGRHREYFIDEGRSAHDFPPLRADQPAYFRPFNLLTLIATKGADLLFGEDAQVRVDDDAAQKIIDGIVARSWLPAVLHGASVDCNVCGDTYLDVTRRGGGNAYIGHVPADEVYPLGVAGPDFQHSAYAMYRREIVGGENGSEAYELLLEVIYTAGKIERKCYRLQAITANVIAGYGSALAASRANPVPLDQWPARTADGQPLPETEKTGLSRPSLVLIPNGYDACSDFDGLLDSQDALHAANTQIGRILAKHADPKIAAPAATGNEGGNVPNRAEVFYFQTKDQIPQYITWNAELEAAMQDRDFAMQSLATQAEMPLSLLGVKNDATAESATKMRLSASSALAKVARKASYWKHGIALAIDLAFEAETGGRLADMPGVEMRDGLPADDRERAETIATYVQAGVMSKRRALQSQYLDAQSVIDELAELANESKQETPDVLFGETGGDASRPPVAGRSATNNESEVNDA